MKRQIIQQLRNWKAGSERKPLILMGARQVGKTYALKTFAAGSYQNFVYINFEDDPKFKSLFEKSLQPENILNLLTIETGIEIIPGETLIIFDEVQECPNALNSLKYFNEQANEYHICAAGSLLGVKLSHTKGFPVGKVNFLELYPLSFLEFLEAIGESKLRKFIAELEGLEPLPTILHEKLLEYFKVYVFVGGMPDAIVSYINSKDFSSVREIQQSILKAYALDFAKHAPPNEIMKISQVWDSIPNQLAKENKKFIYSTIRKGARAKEFEKAIQWLKEAGLIHKVYNISTPKLPLDAYATFDFFKIYLVDVGLLGAMSNLPANAIIHGDQLFQEFRGAITENYIAQELARHHYSLYYWTSEGSAELDFVIQHESAIYPLEIKAGESSRKKSLRIYADKYKPELLLISSSRNLKKDGNILNCPLYLIGELSRILESS